MNRAQINERLLDKHKDLVEFVCSLDDKDFVYSVDNKWTAGQQLDHIYRSVSALTQALALPRFIIRLIIGRANRPSKNYEELVAKYKLKLAGGGKAVGRFVPKPVFPDEKPELKNKLLHSIDVLCKRVDSYTEHQLDYYILPHPLLGKLTLREMLFFTIYHAEHHHQLTIRNLATRTLDSARQSQ